MTTSRSEIFYAIYADGRIKSTIHSHNEATAKFHKEVEQGNWVGNVTLYKIEGNEKRILRRKLLRGPYYDF